MIVLQYCFTVTFIEYESAALALQSWLNWKLTRYDKELTAEKWNARTLRVTNPTGSRKWKPCTYEAARVGPFLFYQTSALLKTWFLSSWGLCEESLGCYWHCQAQGFLARERQINCCKTQKRNNCSFWGTIHKEHKASFL